MNEGRRPGPSQESAVLSPKAILDLDPSEADQLLDRLESEVPVFPPLIDLLPESSGEAIVFGDTHGDWRSTLRVADRFLAAPRENVLLGLGDYVDRAPDDAREGSVANALYLLQLAATYPHRVFLLQGNHETARRIGVLPHDLPEEIDLLWGPEADRYSRLMSLIERGPLAALLRGAAYFAHAGFPRSASAGDWRSRFEHVDEGLLIELVWAECGASRTRRGVARPFDETELERFLAATGAHVFLRGHDPDLAGRSVYGNRCLTLHTSRVYERFGGVLAARLPLDSPVRSTTDIRVEHLETEGKEFAAT